MSARKLQQEFDKTNKKIAEGLTVFDDTYEKLMTTEISSQKEKLESDLKKEIKKLQRLRDSLKTWLSDSSIKLDKNVLQDNRTKIEHAMDLFKDLEKLSKIKQFSNEGLELQSQQTKSSKFDPENVKKNSAYSYISDVIDQIGEQNESLEQEIHQFSLQLKKTKSSNSHAVQSSIDDARHKLERNNSHLSRLDSILNNLENDKLDPARIDDIKDDLDYYVENNQDEDYVEYDDFYDQLEIEEEEETDDKENGETKEVKDKETDSKEIESETKEEPKEAKVPKEPAKDVKETTKEAKEIAKEPKETKDSKDKDAKESKDLSYPSVGKKKVVPAPNPPPITGANSYSTIIKAAQAAAASPQVANATPKPPGLNQVRSRSASPQVQLQQLHEDKKDSPENLSETSFLDSIPKVSNILTSRLQNPIASQTIDQYLESSLLNCPDSFDAEVPRQYQAVNNHPSSIDYPQEPMYELSSSHIMRKFDNDTLFFCFYYCDGPDSLARWNAAQEMSKRGWIFNTETSQWFAKDQKAGKNKSVSASPSLASSTVTTPVDSTPEGEAQEENYKYFDYEKTWLIRRKENYILPHSIRQTFP